MSTRRLGWNRRLALGAVAAAGLLGAPRGLGAAASRVADQRLVAHPDAEEQSHFGSTVAMSRTDLADAFALVGQPTGCLGARAAMNHFRYDRGSGWDDYQTACTFPSASPQAMPIDVEGSVGYTAVLDFVGGSEVWRFGWAGWIDSPLVDLQSGGVRALAHHVGVLALGLPDYSEGRGLIWIAEPDGSGGWEIVDGFTGVDPGDRLGSALAAKPGLLVAGAPGYGDNGAVFVYVRSSGWIEWQRLDSPATSQTGAEFGAAVDIDAQDAWIAVGSPDVDRVTSPGARVDVGAVYLYRNVGVGWQYETLLRPPGAASYDHFGTSVALHDVVLVGGSPGEDGAVGGEGAAYVYQRSGSLWSTVPRLRLFDAAAEEHDALGTSVAAGDLGALVGAPYYDGNDVSTLR